MWAYYWLSWASTYRCQHLESSWALWMAWKSYDRLAITHTLTHTHLLCRDSFLRKSIKERRECGLYDSRCTLVILSARLSGCVGVIPREGGTAWILSFLHQSLSFCPCHQVITLEGWVDIMYYVMDAHSFYNFIYFILLIIVSTAFLNHLYKSTHSKDSFLFCQTSAVNFPWRKNKYNSHFLIK